MKMKNKHNALTTLFSATFILLLLLINGCFNNNTSSGNPSTNGNQNINSITKPLTISSDKIGYESTLFFINTPDGLNVCGLDKMSQNFDCNSLDLGTDQPLTDTKIIKTFVVTESGSTFDYIVTNKYIAKYALTFPSLKLSLIQKNSFNDLNIESLVKDALYDYDKNAVVLLLKRTVMIVKIGNNKNDPVYHSTFSHVGPNTGGSTDFDFITQTTNTNNDSTYVLFMRNWGIISVCSSKKGVTTGTCSEIIGSTKIFMEDSSTFKAKIQQIIPFGDKVSSITKFVVLYFDTVDGIQKLGYAKLKLCSISGSSISNCKKFTSDVIDVADAFNNIYLNAGGDLAYYNDKIFTAGFLRAGAKVGATDAIKILPCDISKYTCSNSIGAIKTTTPYVDEYKPYYYIDRVSNKLYLLNQFDVYGINENGTITTYSLANTDLHSNISSLQVYHVPNSSVPEISPTVSIPGIINGVVGSNTATISTTAHTQDINIQWVSSSHGIKGTFNQTLGTNQNSTSLQFTVLEIDKALDYNQEQSTEPDSTQNSSILKFKSTIYQPEWIKLRVTYGTTSYDIKITVDVNDKISLEKVHFNGISFKENLKNGDVNFYNMTNSCQTKLGPKENDKNSVEYQSCIVDPINRRILDAGGVSSFNIIAEMPIFFKVEDKYNNKLSANVLKTILTKASFIIAHALWSSQFYNGNFNENKGDIQIENFPNGLNGNQFEYYGMLFDQKFMEKFNKLSSALPRTITYCRAQNKCNTNAQPKFDYMPDKNELLLTELEENEDALTAVYQLTNLGTNPVRIKAINLLSKLWDYSEDKEVNDNRTKNPFDILETCSNKDYCPNGLLKINDLLEPNKSKEIPLRYTLDMTHSVLGAKANITIETKDTKNAVVDTLNTPKLSGLSE